MNLYLASKNLITQLLLNGIPRQGLVGDHAIENQGGISRVNPTHFPRAEHTIPARMPVLIKGAPGVSKTDIVT